MSITKKILMCSSQGNTDNWFLEYGGNTSGTSNTKGRVAIGPSGTVYLLSEGSGSTYSAQFSIAKLDTDGNLDWQKQLGWAGVDVANGISVDTNDNVYVCGNRTGFNPGGDGIYVSKLNSSGAKQYESFFGTAGGLNKGYSIAAASPFSYVAGTLGNQQGGTSQWGVFQLDVNGSVVWAKRLGTTFQESQAFGIFYPSQGSNVYVTGYTTSTTFTVAKYSTSGNLQWQETLSGFAPSQGNDIHVDDSGDVYVAGTIRDGSHNAAALVKLSSTGNLVWQRVLTSGAANDEANAVTVGSDGFVYLCGTTPNASSKPNMLLAKYNSSGAIQWQRTFGGVGSEEQFGYGLGKDIDGNIYFSGHNAGASGSKALLIKPPTNGSGTGIYEDFVYAKSNLTEKAGSMSILSASQSDVSVSISTSTQTSSISNATLTTDLVHMQS